MVRALVAVGVVVTLTFGSAAIGVAQQPVGLVGQAATGGSYVNGRPVIDLGIHAFLEADGSVSGNLYLGLAHNAETVIQLVPPSGGGSAWCITTDRDGTGTYHLVIWILDVGDGRTSFDHVGGRISGGSDIDCGSFGGPPAAGTPLVSGDFRAIGQ